MKRFLAPHLLAVLALIGCNAAPTLTPAATEVLATEPAATAITEPTLNFVPDRGVRYAV